MGQSSAFRKNGPSHVSLADFKRKGLPEEPEEGLRPRGVRNVVT